MNYKLILFFFLFSFVLKGTGLSLQESRKQLTAAQRRACITFAEHLASQSTEQERWNYLHLTLQGLGLSVPENPKNYPESEKEDRWKRRNDIAAVSIYTYFCTQNF